MTQEYKVEDAQMAALHCQGLRVRAPYDQAGAAFGRLFAAVGAGYAGQKVMMQCLDPPGAEQNPEHNYVVMLGDEKPFAAVAGLEPFALPAGRVLQTLHRGAYAKVGAAYGAIGMQMGARHLQPRAAPFEIYLNDPALVAEEQLETLVCMPVQ